MVDRDIAVEAKGVGVFDVRANSDDLWHVLPSREPGVVSILRDVLRPGDVFVDAGANIGFYSVLAGKLVGSDGKVVAVEMMPDTARVLRKHVAMNGLENVTVFEHALASTAGGSVAAQVTEGKFGQASIAGRPGARSVAVTTITLDNLLEGLVDAGRPIRLVKMDLEGAEPDALMGARAALARIEKLIFESVRSDCPASAFLAAHGFSVAVLSGKDRVAVREL